jgi:redox-sensitive bicupin YhaK (pirin superfamily)
MKTIFHKSEGRGHADHGWLNTYHSFSFASYYDPQKVHFGALRVLNDDTVQGGQGFGRHSHDNMEIVSIPLSGDLQHQDSTGRSQIIKQGDIQIMSAGRGIEHSEKNANDDKEVKFFQIWVYPKVKDITPRYDQKSFSTDTRKNRWQTIVAPDNKEAVFINQDAWFCLGNLDKNLSLPYQLHNPDNGVYLFVIKGKLEVDGQILNSRDALAIWETPSFNIQAQEDSEVLLIEVPMIEIK